jgi:hypothetical protein
VRVSRIFRYVSGLQSISHHQQADVEASPPAWQREDDDRSRRRAVLTGAAA